MDAHEPYVLARFWAEALEYEIVTDDAGLVPEQEIGIRPHDRNGLHILFEPVDDAKAGKNRLHLDLRPADQGSEVQRLKELGATEVDVGQGEDVTWVVMADPEGNEFCVLRPLRPGEEGP